METTQMTKTERNALAFKAKNERRKAGKALADRGPRLAAAAARRARVDGAFGNLDGEDYEFLAIGTTGTRGGEDQ